jgi:hypothetical protein
VRDIEVGLRLVCIRARPLAVPWSFYIFSSGGSANELGIVNFDLEFLEKFGVLRHFLA